MKVSPVVGSMGYRVVLQRDRREEQISQQHESADSNPDASDHSSNQEEERQAQEHLLAKALDLFHADEQTQANGLTASIQGSYPHLMVMLRDRSGSSIREFTAGEFIQLRGSSFKEGGTRGKLLDRKL